MKDYQFEIEYNKPLASGVYEMKLRCLEQLPAINCGQFVHVKLLEESNILRRPFCICEYGADFITIVYALVGAGTHNMAKYKAGDKLDIIAPIGNGFTLSEKHKKVLLLGGGVGVAPLLSVPKTFPNREYVAYLGYSSKDAMILTDKFSKIANTFIFTDDGSYGEKGYPTSALEARIAEIAPDVILTCGNEHMLKAVAKLSYNSKIPAYMSGESRMGCGVGACLVCAVALRGADGSITHKRACVDGPVFDLSEVIL